MKGLIFLLCMTQLSWAIKVEVLQPVKNGTFDVGVIITPGAEIAGVAYKPLGEALQRAFPGRMWVGLLDGFLLNTPNPLQLGSAIDEAFRKFHDAGFVGSDVFLAGHSLGGVFVASYGKSHPDRFKGVMLLASYLTRGNQLRDYPLPVLTISGDIDGLTRITRIVDTFEELENETIHNPSPVSLMYSRPVIVMPGINHGHFASGNMPSNVKSHDFDVDDDVTYDSAHETIAGHLTSFVIATLGQPLENRLTAFAALKAAYFATQEIIDPLSKIKALDVNVQQQSRSCLYAQDVIAGNELQSHLSITNGEISEESVPFYVPNSNVTGAVAHVQTYACVISPWNPADVSLDPQTPSEIQAIIESREGLLSLLPTVNDSSPPTTCKDINKFLYALALNASSPTAHARAKNRNSPAMIFHDDVEIRTAAQWVTSSLTLTYSDDGKLEVTSYANYGYTSSHVTVPKGDILRCKILSPYRAMEWFYLDSLKR